MDCGYKFRLDQNLEKGLTASPQTRTTRSYTAGASNSSGKVLWIILAVALFIVGIMIGGGVGLIQPPTKLITSTITQFSTKSLTTTKIIPPSTVTSISTSIKTITKTLSVTLTKTKTVTVTTSPKPSGEFKIISGELVMKEDSPYLYVKFNTPVDATIKLIGPDGEEKDSQMVSPEETGVYLRMIGGFISGETPSPGKYKVILRSTFGGNSVEKDFEFKGYDVKAVKLDFEGKDWSDLFGGSLKSIVVYLKNDGDLPTYVEKAKVVFDGETTIRDLVSTAVPPGDSVVEISVYMVGIKAGTHNVEVSLINDKGEQIATIQGKVTFP